MGMGIIGYNCRGNAFRSLEFSVLMHTDFHTYIHTWDVT